MFIKYQNKLININLALTITKSDTYPKIYVQFPMKLMVELTFADMEEAERVFDYMIQEIGHTP